MKFETIRGLWFFVFVISIIASMQIRFPLGLIPVAIILILGYFFQPSRIYKYFKKETK